MPDFSDILKSIDKAINRFNDKIPSTQEKMLSGIQDELKRLDTSNGRIKTTVANLKIIQSIKNKLTRLIVTSEYLKDVKDFVAEFNNITKLQNEYWQSVEDKFTPSPLLREIRKQSISDTVKNLTSSGIGAAVSDQIATILRTNITAGGSYAKLTEQLREKILNTKTEGALSKYAKQITIDSLNQYTAQYNQSVSSDLGFEWYAYQGSEIMTSRPFCQSMVENNRYFHISQVPNLLKGLDAQGNRLKYIDNKTNEEKKVLIYDKTGLPYGFIAGTNPDNFFINRGGYGCGHQARPVSESIVPVPVRDFVYATAEYKRWKGSNL
jgi:hypothetical protein